MIDVRRHKNADELARTAADLFVKIANQAIMVRRNFNVALSGGSTPAATHRAIGLHHADGVDWQKVYVFWGDERPVGPEHQDSNYRMASETLLSRVPIPEEHVSRIQAERDTNEAADAYERTLRSHFGNPGSTPAFDLILLGLGDDGHTASLFPHTQALSVTDQLVVANHVASLNSSRITFSAQLINAARNVVFLVQGARKANILQEVLNGPYQPEKYPSQLVKPVNGRLIWMVDEAAAGQLTQEG